MKLTHRGRFVRVTYEGRTVTAMVGLCSENGVSAALLYEGVLGGFVGMIPIRWDEEHGEYRDFMFARPLVIVDRSAAS